MKKPTVILLLLWSAICISKDLHLETITFKNSKGEKFRSTDDGKTFKEVKPFQYNGNKFINSKNETFTSSDGVVWHFEEQMNSDFDLPVKIFPNPSNGDITIEFEDDDSTINYEIIDMTGRVVSTGQNNTNQVTPYFKEGIQRGQYLVRIHSETGEYKVINLFIE